MIYQSFIKQPLWTILKTWSRVSRILRLLIPRTRNPRRRKQTRYQRKGQTILEFLRNCTPYEADSIRGMVGYGTGKGDIGTIEATDMLAVNRFLNHGLTKENGTSSEAVMKHRQERAQKLMEAVKGFVDISQLCRISVALMKISSDFKAVEDARGHLQSQSVANGNRKLMSNWNGISDNTGTDKLNFHAWDVWKRP